MENVCDICGFNYPPDAHYCGGCGVDLKDKTELHQPVNPKKKSKSSKKKNPTKDSQSNDKIIRWCQIHALMNWHEMTLPLFLYFVLVFAKGQRDLGFCDCAVCNLGYRELQSEIINLKEKKKIKPTSKGIVSKYHDADIASLKFHFPRLINENTSNEDEDNELISSKNPHKIYKKVTIEISSDVIENLILNVLSSEKGKQIIKKFRI